MQDVNPNDFNVSSSVKPHQDVDVKFLVAKVMGNWYWYVISIALFIAVAFICFYYIPPYYTVETRVLVTGYNSQGRQITGTDESTLLSDLNMSSYPNSVTNELEIIHSRSIIEKAMKDLQTNVQYYGQGPIRYEEIYKASPYIIQIINLNDPKIIDAIEYDVRVNGNKVSFEDEDSDSSFTASFGDTLHFTYGTWVLQHNIGVTESNPNHRLGLTINSYHATLYALMDDIEAITTNEYVNIVDMTITQTCPQKYEDLFRHMLDLYVQSDKDEHNRIADSTIAFINNRLLSVTDDLTNIDKNIEAFKKENHLTDLTDDQKQLLQQSTSVTQQLSDKDVQLQVVGDLEKYLSDDHNNSRVMPTTAPIQDAAFVQTLDKYNSLQLQRQSLLQNSTEQNPNIKSIDIQLSQLRGDLLSLMRTFKKGVSTEQSSLASRNSQVAGSINQVPTQERVYMDFTRKQNVMQSLYLYLLQTREQTEVSKSNNVGPIRVLDQPQRAPMQLFPTWIILIPSAIFLGLLIPSVVIFMKELLNTRVITTHDISNATNAPVVADISHAKTDVSPVVISKESRGEISEQFRTLRTNLHFLMDDATEKTIMVTSSMGGEGKSFIAINLASAIALSGKRVLLMELDMRKPHIASLLQLDDAEGFSNYITSDIRAADVIKPSNVNPDFYYMGPGILPPNPAELLVNDKVKQLFDEVKNQFDYILIDCAPIGLVTDALLLRKYVDTVLYVVRQKFTYKKQINLIQGLVNDRKFKNLNIVFNDIKPVPGYGYGYAYNSYSKGYDYYGERRPFFKRMFGKKKSGIA